MLYLYIMYVKKIKKIIFPNKNQKLNSYKNLREKFLFYKMNRKIIKNNLKKMIKNLMKKIFKK